MSAPRKVVEEPRAIGVMAGGPLVVLIAALAAVRSIVRAIIRGRPPSLPAALGLTAVLLYAGRCAAGCGAGERAPLRERRRAGARDRGGGAAGGRLAAARPDRPGPLRLLQLRLLENLAGCRMRNAERIHLEWQHREVGDKVLLHPLNGLPVSRFELGREIALEGWGSFAVEPIDAARSRVVCRGEPRESLRFAVYYALFVELPQFLMERWMLLGIKRRAERAAAGRTLQSG